MKDELKCIICGTLATTFFLAHNNPICEVCRKKLEEVPQKDIELTREYVRRFVRDLSSIIEGPEQQPKKKDKK